MRLGSKLREQPNPFVVLFDVTLALAFIIIVFAVVFSINNSQSLTDSNKRERQEAVRRDLAERITTVLGGGRVGKIDPVSREQAIYDPSGKLIAMIYENASFQRICIFVPLFEPGASLMSPLGERLYRDLAKAIARRWEAGRDGANFSYLLVEGVADRDELGSDEERTALSRRRADGVAGLLLSESSRPDPGQQQGRIPARYTVPFGLGSALYADSPVNRRVDLVLFYPETPG